MSKKLGISVGSTTGTATVSNWKSATKVEILNNSSTLPIRIDKFMAAVSGWHGHTGNGAYVGVVVHLSDTNGNTFLDTVDGSGADTTNDVNTLMEKWKDYIWMTDFKAWGPAVAAPMLNNIELDAATKRVLEPGQKLYVSVMWMAATDNSAVSLYYLLDYGLWYQQAAPA